MAVSPALVHRDVRYGVGAREPDHAVEGAGASAGDGVPAHPPVDQPRALVPGAPRLSGRLRHHFLKVQYYFEAVRRTYHHPVRVNFFAPWIAAMFLAIGVPSVIAASAHPAVWCCLMLPVFCLELKIYGQWLSGGQRRLSKVVDPSGTSSGRRSRRRLGGRSQQSSSGLWG